MRWLAKVPGKAVLIGEYAVTDGLPAYAMAVDRYAKVWLEPCSADACQLEAPQLCADPFFFQLDSNGVVNWDRDHKDWQKVAWTANLIDRLLGGVLDQHLAADSKQALMPFRLTIDTSALFLDLPHDDQYDDQFDDQSRPRVKLGLGSSSAIAVGLFLVLLQHVQQSSRPDDQLLPTPESTLNTLLPVYREAQNGQGSGIDLAAAIYGGLVVFSNRQSGQCATEQLRVNSARWPDSLLLDFAWTGRSASTTTLLKHYRQWQQTSPDQATQWNRRARTMLKETAQALSAEDADLLVQLLSAYGRAMSTIGGWMGLDLTPETHLMIMQQAKRLGLAAKPSGAGVGDLALIAGTDAKAMQQMRDWMSTQGITRVAMNLSPEGARVERVGR